MICAFQLVLVVLPSAVLSASMKKMLDVEVQPNKRSLDDNKMVVDHIVEVEEGETVFLPSPSPLPPGKPYSVSWSRRGKEIFR